MYLYHDEDKQNNALVSQITLELKENIWDFVNKAIQCQMSFWIQYAPIFGLIFYPYVQTLDIHGLVYILHTL